jgi:hypothetical protein
VTRPILSAGPLEGHCSCSDPILLEAWSDIEVPQHAIWLGPLLVAALLRQEGLAANHLAGCVANFSERAFWHESLSGSGRRIMFKGRHFDRSGILLCVRWYLAYSLSLRDLKEMMAERGINVDHTTIHRWVVHFSPVAAGCSIAGSAPLLTTNGSQSPA